MAFQLELFTTDATQAGTYSASLAVSLVSFPTVTTKVDFTITMIYAVNHLPAFDKKITSATVQMTKTPSAWTLDLPKIIDADNDAVTLSADLGAAASFITLRDKSALDISDISTSGSCKAGNYLLVFFLNDSKEIVKVPFSLVVLKPPADPDPIPQANNTDSTVS